MTDTPDFEFPAISGLAIIKSWANCIFLKDLVHGAWAGAQTKQVVHQQRQVSLMAKCNEVFLQFGGLFHLKDQPTRKETGSHSTLKSVKNKNQYYHFGSSNLQKSSTILTRCVLVWNYFEPFRTDQWTKLV